MPPDTRTRPSAARPARTAPTRGWEGRPATTLVRAMLIMLTGSAGAHAADTSPAQQLARFSVQAGAPGQATRGQQFFTSTHGGTWSCASCHGQQPTQTGQHASTGKPIAPLAPGFEARRFTDTAKVDKWFRRNCGDVLKRDCSAAEQADVMAYLISLKP